MFRGHRLYLSLAIVCLATCRPYKSVDYEPYQTSRYPCLGSGWDNKQAPIVCVNSNTLAVSPEPVRAHRHEKGNSKNPVVIQWFTSSGGGDLQIKMKEDGCLVDISCPGRGHCRARTDLDGTKPDCKYSVILDGVENDPTVIVDQCCM